MNLNPTLGRTDRIGSFVIGAALFAYAFLAGFEKMWLQGLCAGLGLAFAIGGIGGT